jgi:uncharacterized protein (DUF488 family)
MLYTFGYEGLDIDSFISRLKEVGIKTIVDVRQLPLSRKKGFSKRSFATALADVGIAYSHWPMLGCPKVIRDTYKADADWKRYTSSFNAYLREQDSTIRELATAVRGTTACLICFEADYSFCHRTFVARAAHRHGAPSVAHITAQTVLADSPLRVAA